MTEALRTQSEPIGGEPSRGERWLVIGDAPLAELSRRVTGAQVDQTPSYMTALAELARAPASVVLGPVSRLHGEPAATAMALRELAPQARLIVTAHPHERDAADTAVQAGFDQRLMLPADAGQLAEAIVATSHESPDAPRDEELGDIDLVNAVLAGHGKLPALALRLLRSQSGIAEVALAADGQRVPADHVSAPVPGEKGALGVLHAPPPAAEAQLRVWADWLARWLTLHERYERFKDLSLRDELTGVWNRRYFNRFLRRILDWAGRDRSQVTLLVFDIDDFKVYNDHYGHWAGDEILRETARLMRSVCREHDVVARIGGDEFAVIFWDAEAPRQPHRHPPSRSVATGSPGRHPQDVLAAADRFQRAICSHAFPKLLDEAPGTLTISGGLASYPWDGRTPNELLRKADEMAMASKRSGKNAITFGPGASKACGRSGD